MRGYSVGGDVVEGLVPGRTAELGIKFWSPESLFSTFPRAPHCLSERKQMKGYSE